MKSIDIGISVAKTDCMLWLLWKLRQAATPFACGLLVKREITFIEINMDPGAYLSL